MRILITGGTGLIGQALCQHWQPQGHELWVWSRRPPAVAALCSGARGVAKLEDLPADMACLPKPCNGFGINTFKMYVMQTIHTPAQLEQPHLKILHQLF